MMDIIPGRASPPYPQKCIPYDQLGKTEIVIARFLQSHKKTKKPPKKGLFMMIGGPPRGSLWLATKFPPPTRYYDADNPTDPCFVWFTSSGPGALGPGLG